MINFYFYFLFFVVFISGLLVIFSKNPVQSVLFLVLVFCISGQFLLLLEVDFLAMILIIVYVGAIAVLFLFIVMMLNIRVVEMNEILNRYFPLGFFIGFLIFCEILFSLYYSTFLSNNGSIFYENWYETFLNHSNVVSLGLVLYTYFAPLLIVSGVLLLLAMVSSIMLTLDNVKLTELDFQKNKKKQLISDQVDRPVNDLNF